MESKYKEALKKIANPVKYLEDEAKKIGANLNGHIAVELANDANYLRGIAINALKGE